MKKNLEAILKLKGLSLTDLSKKSGVPRSTLYNWTDESSVNLNQVKAVASSLEVSVYELCFGTRDPYAASAEEILEEIFSGDVRDNIQRIKKKKDEKK